MNSCTCNRCGWVHMAVTQEYAKEESENFLKYYDLLNDTEREKWYGNKRPDPMGSYSRCFFCGQTDRDFRVSKDGDCPDGCTIQATIWEPE